MMGSQKGNEDGEKTRSTRLLCLYGFRTRLACKLTYAAAAANFECVQSSSRRVDTMSVALLHCRLYRAHLAFLRPRPIVMVTRADVVHSAEPRSID